MVAQVDEQHAAMVADAMAPARQPHGLADVALAQRAAGVGAIAMHGHSWAVPAAILGWGWERAGGARKAHGGSALSRQALDRPRPNLHTGLSSSAHVEIKTSEKAQAGRSRHDHGRGHGGGADRAWPRHRLCAAGRAQRPSVRRASSARASACGSCIPATSRARPIWRWGRRSRPASRRPMRWCRGRACSIPARRCSPPTA